MLNARYSRGRPDHSRSGRLETSQRALPGIDQFYRPKAAAVMGAVDVCNARWGRRTVVFALAGFDKSRPWSTEFEMGSSRYTTCIDELPAVGAGALSLDERLSKGGGS
jgi:hypothetical protein